MHVLPWPRGDCTDVAEAGFDNGIAYRGEPSLSRSLEEYPDPEWMLDDPAPVAGRARKR
jgi:hypothetical protein